MEDWKKKYEELHAAVLLHFEHCHPGVGIRKFPKPWQSKAFKDNLIRAKMYRDRLRFLVGLLPRERVPESMQEWAEGRRAILVLRSC